MKIMLEDIAAFYSPEELNLYEDYWKSEDKVNPGGLDEEDYEMLIGIGMMKQEYGRVAAIIEETLSLFPDDDEFLLCKVELLAAEEKTDEAFRLLDEIVEFHPNNEECYVLRAGLCMSQERYDEAEQLYRQYEAMGGDPALAAAGLAQCLAVRGQRQEGFQKICAYLQLDQESIEACNRFIIWVMEWEMLDEAAVVLRKMTVDNPYNKCLWKTLYEVCELLEDYESAKEANEYTLAIDPDDYEGHGRRILYADLYDAEAVEESFKRFKPERWTDTQRLYLYSVIADYYAQHDNAEKERYYLRELLKSPLEPLDVATLSYRLASRVFKRDDLSALKEALFYFRKAENVLEAIRNPEPMLLSDVCRGIGQCLLLVGDSDEEGLAYLQKAWRVCDENALAVLDYFMNLFVLAYYDRAMTELDEALRTAPDNPYYLLMKGALLYYMRQPKQAEPWFVKTVASLDNALALAEELLPDIMQDASVRKIFED